jgi:hypothetical protein
VPGVSRPAPGPVGFKEFEPHSDRRWPECAVCMPIRSPCKLSSRNHRTNPICSREAHCPAVGTHLASIRCTPWWFHDFLVPHCSHYRHPGSPYLVLWAFNPSALAISEFFPPDLLDSCPNVPVIVTQQTAGRVPRAPKSTEYGRYAAGFPGSTGPLRSAFNRSRISANSFSSAEGPFGGAGLRKRFTCWITTNRTIAIIRNSIIVFRNAP